MSFGALLQAANCHGPTLAVLPMASSAPWYLIGESSTARKTFRFYTRVAVVNQQSSWLISGALHARLLKTLFRKCPPHAYFYSCIASGQISAVVRTELMQLLTGY